MPVGEWAAQYAVPVTDENAWCGQLSPETLAQSRRSYYAQITHVDAQIGRFIEQMETLVDAPTWFVFTSDHGEMLGDHHLFRKTYAYEGSAKVPLIVLPPGGSRQHCSDAPVSHCDIMPTLLDAAGVDIPERVEGRSLTPLLESSSEKANWRKYIHGEHSPCYHADLGMQFLTDGKEKYIWYTETGEEQLFDLVQDPEEIQNIAEIPQSRQRLEIWRSRMVKELAERPEDGLSDGKRLLSGKNLPSVRDFLLHNA